MDVSVIFATYNRSDILESVFESWRVVQAHTKYTFEIICSDDASTDNTVEIIKKANDLPIILIENQHGGAGPARNAAINIASGKIVIFTGDDIFPNPEFINQHYENYLKFGEKTASLGRIEWHPDIPMNYLMYHITNVGCEQFGFVGLPPYQLIDFRHFYTSNISVPMRQLKALDRLFNTDFDKYGFEDIELGYRLEQNGMKIYYDPDIVANHHHIYDSVEKFCVRHTTAGEELVVFFRMHPELEDKCIYDIEDLERVFKLYKQKHGAFFSFKGSIVLFAIKMACTITKFLQKRVAWDKPGFWSKIDSILYAGIFKFCFLMGCTLRIAQGDHIHKSQLAYFAYLHMKKNYSKIYWDTGHGMNEVESRKWVCWDKDEVTLTKELPNNVKAIRISPLKNKCIMELQELLIETKNGETIVPAMEWHNAKKTNWKKFDFTNTDDPQIIIKKIPDDSKKLIIKMSVNNMEKKGLYRVARSIMSKIKQRIKINQAGRKTWEAEYATGQPRRIQICVEGLSSNQRALLIDGYKKAVAVLGDAVTVSDFTSPEQGYMTYHYRPEIEPLENTQILQISYMLLNSVYDYVVVSKALTDFPIVGCKSLNDVLIYSELLDISKRQWFIHATGRFMRLPAYNVETNEIDITKIMDGISLQQEFFLSSNKNIRPIFRQSQRTFAFKKNKPVVFVDPIFLAVGGVERNTIEVMRALKDDYTFCMLTMERHSKNQGTLHFQLKGICDYIFDLREITEFDNYLACLYELKQIFNPDILWLCNNSPWFESNIRQVRKIFSNVAMIAQDVYDTRVGWIEYYKNPELKLFNRYIAVTEIIKDTFINKYDIPEEKIDVIYSVIDGEKIRRQLHENPSRDFLCKKYGLNENKRLFGFVGRLTEQKNPIRYLSLVKTVLQKDPRDVHFVMVGTGVLNDEVDKYIAKNKLQEIITRIAYIENTPEFISILDGLILTSCYEGMPIVGIEAMCMGTSILTTDVGDLKRFLENTKSGWIIDETQSDYDNFLHFYHHLSSYKNAAVQHADKMLDFFEADHVAQKYRETFKKALQL